MARNDSTTSGPSAGLIDIAELMSRPAVVPSRSAYRTPDRKRRPAPPLRQPNPRPADIAPEAWPYVQRGEIPAEVARLITHIVYGEASAVERLLWDGTLAMPCFSETRRLWQQLQRERGQGDGR